MAENELLTWFKEDTYANLYVDLVKKASDIVDSYYWIAMKKPNLAEPSTRFERRLPPRSTNLKKYADYRRHKAGHTCHRDQGAGVTGSHEAT